MTNEELLAGIDEMIEEAPGVGLCSFPFKFLRDAVSELIEEKDELKSYREPKLVKPWNGTAVISNGQCPRCNSIFLDFSTPYCGNCGQALQWETRHEED